MSGGTPAVLVTGAGGYLGRRIAHRVLAGTDHDVVVTLRSAAAGAALADELSAVHDHGPGDDRAGRVRVVVADLGDDDPFAGVDEPLRARITRIVHAAAVTRFNVERDLARRVNVEGTAAVVALARSCPRLERLALVSTVYATGLRQGVIAEEPDDGSAGFANHYEWSKWAAEDRVLAAGDDLAWSILRVATVVADDTSGHVTQHNAFHQTLRLCFGGLLSVLPGDAGTPLYFVTGDDVADTVVRLSGPEGPGGVFHLAPERSAVLTLEAALDLVFARFEQVEAFRRRRILRPLLADQESFELLVEGVDAFSGSIVAQALANVAPFARQLYVDKVIDNSCLRAALGDYRPPDPSALVSATVEHLVTDGWGARERNARVAV